MAGDRVEHELNFPGGKRRSAGAASLVRHVLARDGRHDLEELANEMRSATRSGRCKADGARFRLRERDQLAHRFHRYLCVYHEEYRQRRRQNDRREVLQRIVGQVGIDMRTDAMRGDAALEQCVAVGRRLGDEARAHYAAHAGAVVDHDGLAEHFTELLSHDARKQIRTPAGRDKHHHAHWTARIILLRMRGKAATKRNENRYTREMLAHRDGWW